MHFSWQVWQASYIFLGFGNTISSSDSIEVSGVTLDSSLQYATYISNLCSKVSIQIKALEKMGKYINTDCRIAMYKSLISSNFPYCPVSLMFCGNKIQINWKSYYGSKLWKPSENLYHFKKNIPEWCVSSKCDVFIIQWYTWYIALRRNLSH